MRTLAGVTLLGHFEGLHHPDRISPDDWEIVNYARIRHLAAGLGATLINYTDSSTDRLWQEDPHTFALSPPLGASPAEALLRVHDAELRRHIPTPNTRPFLSMPHLERRQYPYILTASHASGEKVKYLIQTDKQRCLVEDLAVEHRRNIKPESLLVSDFIPTPSGHYTSYRIVTSPAAVLAGELLYSSHARYSPRRVVNPNPRGMDILEALAQPSSSYFLNSKAIKSNHGIIPLNGKAVASDEEARILRAHDINPAAPYIPNRLTDQALHVVSKVGHVAGLVMEIDFLQHKVDDELYYLGTNLRPDTKAYAAYHFNGRPETTEAEAHYAMLRHALQSIEETNNRD